MTGVCGRWNSCTVPRDGIAGRCDAVPIAGTRPELGFKGLHDVND